MYQWNSRMGTHLFRTRRREKQSQHETKVVWWKRRVNVLPCFHFICMVYVTFHLRHVYAPRAIHRWNAAPPGTSRTRILRVIYVGPVLRRVAVPNRLAIVRACSHNDPSR